MRLITSSLTHVRFLLLNLVFCVLLFAPSGGAQSLNYSNNFFVTVNYVGGGVGL